MGSNPVLRSRTTKVAVLVLSVVLLGFGARTFLLKGSGCAKQTSKWAKLGFPQTDSNDDAITNFSSKEQLLVDLEDWGGEFECSGNGQLLGRVLAEFKQKNEPLKLSSIVIGVAKRPRKTGPQAAARLEAIFSSKAAQQSYDRPAVAKFVTKVNDESTSFQQALYEIVLQSLPLESAAEFRSQVRLSEILRSIK